MLARRQKVFIEQPNVCAVCGMTVSVKQKITKDYLGDIYVFCSSQCFKKFEESPETYVMEREEEES